MPKMSFILGPEGRLALIDLVMAAYEGSYDPPGNSGDDLFTVFAEEIDRILEPSVDISPP